MNRLPHHRHHQRHHHHHYYFLLYVNQIQVSPGQQRLKREVINEIRNLNSVFIPRSSVPLFVSLSLAVVDDDCLASSEKLNFGTLPKSALFDGDVPAPNENIGDVLDAPDVAVEVEN